MTLHWLNSAPSIIFLTILDFYNAQFPEFRKDGHCTATRYLSKIFSKELNIRGLARVQALSYNCQI
jgi:hypothetical protein